MNYKEIVAEAWRFTLENKRLTLWFGAIPAFFTTVYGIGYIIYQYYAFLSSKLFQNWPHSFLSLVFTTTWDFLLNHRGLIIPMIVIALVLIALYFLVPVICQGGLIQVIARRKNGQQVRARQGVNYGFMTFLPLLEYRIFISTLSVVSIFSIMATAVRNLGFVSLNILVPTFVFVLIAALVMAVCFTYTEFYIVIDGDNVLTAVAKSIKLVVENLEETVLLTILMLIIGLRIIFQVLVVLLIPVVALGAVYLMTLANLPTLGVVTGGVLAVAGLIVASYLNGIIHVFAMTVWTFTFLKLSSIVKSTARDGGEVAVAPSESPKES